MVVAGGLMTLYDPTIFVDTRTLTLPPTELVHVGAVINPFIFMTPTMEAAAL